MALVVLKNTPIHAVVKVTGVGAQTIYGTKTFVGAVDLSGATVTFGSDWNLAKSCSLYAPG